VPLEAGDSEGSGVQRLSSIAIVRDRLIAELALIDGVAIIIGGDCSVELGAIPRIAERDAAIVWFDAHPDLNTPESSPSRALTGMILRTLLGEGPAALVPAEPFPSERVVLAGARSFDPGEDAFVAERGIRMIAADEIGPETVIAAVEATGASTVYIHIDLDVLDPADISGLGAPEPFGVRAGVLVDTIKALLARFPLAGAGITEFAPSSPEDAVQDLPTILRLIGALSAAA
jgi:arginase